MVIPPAAGSPEWRSASAARATHGGKGPYHGAIAVGQNLVWRCPHAHRLRDFSSRLELSALHCAGKVLDAILKGDKNLRAIQEWAARGGDGRPAGLFIEREQWALKEAPDALRAILHSGKIGPKKDLTNLARSAILSTEGRRPDDHHEPAEPDPRPEGVGDAPGEDGPRPQDDHGDPRA